jgi:hypothetical protein
MVELEQVSVEEAEKTAMSHSWNYFAFHAQQRQTVFNFFLILVGASIAAYGGTLGKDGMHDHFKAGLGLLVTISSFLFWRLDRRNVELIKLAEAPLKSFENRLSERTGIDVGVLTKSDHRKNGAFSYFESFSQIYRCVFCLAGVGGIAVFLVAVKRLYF